MGLAGLATTLPRERPGICEMGIVLGAFCDSQCAVSPLRSAEMLSERQDGQRV